MQYCNYHINQYGSIYTEMSRDKARFCNTGGESLGVRPCPYWEESKHLKQNQTL